MAANTPPRPIDWQAIHRRMDLVRIALEQGFTLTVEDKKKILRARAKALAHEPEASQEGREQLEVVEFCLAYERYAIELSYVREVYPLKELTLLPDTPAFLAGIINVRGQIVSVVDLKKFFTLPEKGLTDLNKVIIVNNGHIEFGLLVDAVAGVRRIPVLEVQPPLPTLTGIHREYLRGVTSRHLVILDAAKILADSKIIVREET
ncbi:MAG: chemotaxis protein CheW [Candidatus Binatia bacterium]